jgi:hypothetical protein
VRKKALTPPWGDRFASVEYTDDSLQVEEKQVSELLVMAANRVQALASIRNVRHALELGERRAKVDRRGNVIREPEPDHEVRKNRFAWAVIQELVLCGRFSTSGWTDGGESEDGQIWECTFDSDTRIRYEETGISVVPVADSRAHRELLAALRSRRPSKKLIQAWCEYIGPLRKAETELASLRPASQADLVRYLRSGAAEKPDDWSRRNGVRLEPVPWPILAAALIEAGIRPQRGLIYRSVPGLFGRRRDMPVYGWDLEWRDRGIGETPFLVSFLARDGTVLDHWGSAEEHPGKAPPSRFRDLAQRHRLS